MIIVLFTLIFPCNCAPKQHRHRRHLYALQTRHKSIQNENPKPIEFSGSLKDIDALNDEDKSKLLHGLQKYIIKYAPELILSKRPKISKFGAVNDEPAVNISIHSNSSELKAAEERKAINSSLFLTKYAKQKIEMALIPQFAILKRKMSEKMRSSAAA
uniref:Uncharacterized protein n=1 Tax=Panagrolaimus davidi TaxID=227884 RepID=A0A914QDF7_9BILA